MPYAIEVKHDTKHRKWHRLSVSILEPMSSVASQYADQYAIDRQMNPHQIAFRLVHKITGETIEHISNAQANKGA
jgi:hypothetical protein